MSNGQKYANGQIAFSFLEDGSGFAYYKTGERAHARVVRCARIGCAALSTLLARRSRRRVREHGQRLPESLLLLRR